MSFGCNESFVCVVVCPSYCLTRNESFGQIGYPLEGFGSFVCVMDCLSHCLTDRLKRQCLFGRDSFKRSNRSSVARSDYRIAPSSVAVLNRLSRHFFIEGHLKEPNRSSVLRSANRLVPHGVGVLGRLGRHSLIEVRLKDSGRSSLFGSVYWIVSC